MTLKRTESLARRTLVLVAGLCAFACTTVLSAAVPIYNVEVVHTYPHDASAFTEGLFYLNGFLYESTGLEGHSSIRKVKLETGEVVQKVDIPKQYFGEGIVSWQGHLISLTWKSEVGFVFRLNDLKLERKFQYSGEGWALTRNDTQIIMSDGTPELRFLDPKTLTETGRIQVTLEGKAVHDVNELEWIKGEIYANVWQTNWILRIDPRTGTVLGLINLAGLLKATDIVRGQTDVLNGIAYDAKADRIFVTGKNWPKLFEIRVVSAGSAAPKTSP
jgi:glutaminyl-peptide cyclotransferase